MANPAAAGTGPRSRAALVKGLIRRRYTDLAETGAPGAARKAIAAGYPADWLDRLAEGVAARFSGCGFALDRLDLADVAVVVDLGCGTGLDAALIAQRLPPRARVVALDLTPAMLRRVRLAAAAAAAPVVPVAGDMERLPLADGAADLVVANASFNLTLDKQAAFAEARRILRPGGRLVARDLVRVGDLPPELLADPMAWNTSLGGVLEEPELRAAMGAGGFEQVRISDHRPFPPVVSVRLEATRP